MQLLGLTNLKPSTESPRAFGRVVLGVVHQPGLRGPEREASSPSFAVGGSRRKLMEGRKDWGTKN
jgi:hypothetical protein